eukprot:TRINITY_DN7931_c0_g1_i4.p1 TRINITY_DN7931_c0_g1~~TRINITY_DN7931_c0_g1_i4.p1  ORF type:complete len:348 (-),score=75.14 TRINITY_DN7931_c0_g1_i4:838-1881(-)
MGDEDYRSSSEEPNGEMTDWVFYRDRPEWRDVTPVPQDDGANPVVRIAYSERFTDVYDYFRGVMRTGEKSARVLQLTEDALEQNPANYTVWYYRREVLKALDSDLKKEMKYCRDMIEDHPKNYQVWQHRRALIEWTQDPTAELRFTEMILSGDQKNYHAWQHRQWVLATFNLWDKELAYIDDLIEVDIRNNSAWNQRFFVISHSEGWTPEVVDREVNFALDKIKKVVKNESSWNYLKGVLNACDNEEKKGELKLKIRSWCEEKYSQGEESSYMLSFIIDVLQQDLEGIKSTEEKTKVLDRIESLCVRLATHCDTIRANYWNFIKDSAKLRHGGGGGGDCVGQPVAAS